MLLLSCSIGILWEPKILYDILERSSTYSLHIYFNLWVYVILPLSLFLLQRRLSQDKIGFYLRFTKVDLKYFLIGFSVLFVLFAAVLGLPKLEPFLAKWIVRIGYTGLFSVIEQELLFRGLFLSFISEKLKTTKYAVHSNKLALVISSVLFGLAHYFNAGFIGIIVFSLIGTLLGWIFLRTRTLTAPILVHASINILFAQGPL